MTGAVFENTEPIGARRPAVAGETVASTRHFVSIVMPCLNEEQTVATCVRKARGWLQRSGYDGEVLVIDNGSTDGSPELAREAGARVEFESVRGYGSALRRGFREARGDWLVMGDCDDTYEFSDLDALLKPLGEGYDMCVGNRLAGVIAPGAMEWSHRYIGTPAISLMIRVFSGMKVGDSQCGLRAMTRTALEELNLRTDGMELASEMILKAARQGLRVTEVPVPYNERLGEAKLNTLRDGWRHLRFLLLATPKYLYVLPGLFLTVLGILTLAAALPRQAIDIGDRSWQPVFAGGIFLIVGVNACLLGFASSLYTSARGITNEDSFVRFYHRHLGLERLILLGGLLMLAGAVLDIVLAFIDIGGLSPIGIAAIAQTLIIIGTNTILVGFMAHLLEDS